RRVSELRARASVHLRLLRRERRVQARLGLSRLLSLLLLRWPVDRGRGAEPAHADAAARALRAPVRERLGAVARRQPAKVPVQDQPRRGATRYLRAAGGLRREQAAPVQRLLARVTARELP